MSETAEQYIKRILGHIDGKDALKSQVAAPGKFARLIRGVPKSRLMRKPAPDKWSVGEILAHLTDTELVVGYRIRRMLENSGTAIEAYDQDRWAAEGNYGKRDPRESLALFTALRESNLRLMRSLSKEQWQRYGMHAERGIESVDTILRMAAGHDLNHLEQVERILGKRR
jgi:hypothetical protein